MLSNDFIEIALTPELTKEEIRKKVWNCLQKRNLAKFPLPPHHRIPNFVGAAAAGHRLSTLPEFQSANVVKVNPDKPQEEVRFLALQARKKVLVPTPRLRSGLFNLLENAGNDDTKTLRFKSQSGGVKELSTPIELDQKFHADLVVIGSVAVSLTGRRIGKGEGFADLEYAMMKSIKAIDENTKIITTVHDCQIFDDLPSALFGTHDVPVDFIVTPNTIHKVDSPLPRPQCIYWNILSAKKCNSIPVLMVLRAAEEREGVDVTLRDGEEADLESDATHSSAQLKNAPNGRFQRGTARTARDSRQAAEGGTEPPVGFYKTRHFSRGGQSGRGRGSAALRNRGADSKPSNSDKSPAEPSTLHVTISVNKSNQIVNRTVECTTERDRLGYAGDTGDERTSTRSKNKPKVKSNFVIFFGRIPSNCRVRELTSEIAKRDLKPGAINWKKSFAFVHFNNPLEESNSVLQKLQGLTLAGSPLVVEMAKGGPDQQKVHRELSAEEDEIAKAASTPLQQEETDIL